VCGIVGILARGSEVPEQLLERVTQSLAHRGPDDHGTVILRESVPEPLEIGLGNRRLAVLDLSPLGHQPMQDPATGNWLVHNGEIYNFHEVRAKLERDGVRFTSQSDTEVILKAYASWGEDCVAEFRGMFAFALWDAKRHRLLIVRDPLGIKPLYYWRSDRHFVFASELRTVLQTGFAPRDLNPSALLNYLAFGSVYEPDTLIDGVAALPPGHVLSWERGNVSTRRYWDLAGDNAPAGSLDANGISSAYQTQIAALLDESVRMQLVSDVPVGVFLSGGIDSSSLVAILSRAGVRASTFSIVFREAEYSEAEHSRAVANLFKTDHHELPVSRDDALAVIPDALRAMDQPTIDGVNTYLVSHRTRAAGVKVALSGLGGDELFGGYGSFHAVPRMERYGQLWSHVPSVARKAFSGAFELLAPANDQSRKLAALIRGNGNVVHPYFLSRMLFAPRTRASLTPSLTSEAVKKADAPLRESLRQTDGMDAINRVSYLESRCYMLNTLLRDSDVMSMAHGLELRVPLIDQFLARSVMTVPGSLKVGGPTPKHLLVGALGGALPDSIVGRPKKGFTLPFEHWMRDTLRPEIESTLKRMEGGPLREVVDPAAAHKVWNGFMRGETSWSRPWSLFVLQRWVEQNFA
jgi:asparagine synthase (glutamine-hydrolysing)